MNAKFEQLITEAKRHSGLAAWAFETAAGERSSETFVQWIRADQVSATIPELRRIIARLQKEQLPSTCVCLAHARAWLCAATSPGGQDLLLFVVQKQRDASAAPFTQLLSQW